MTARQKIVAGNWKMNKTFSEGLQLINSILDSSLSLAAHQKVIIAPPFIHLAAAAEALKGKAGYDLGAQNCHQEVSGAYTGEVSAAMLQSVGVGYVILGHSERRQYFKEDEALLAKKVDVVLAQGLKVIFCVGEPEQIREEGRQNNYVEQQITKSLFHLKPEQCADLMLAYEPIWAIGTGKTAGKEQAQEMHAHIRKVMSDKFGVAIADRLTILYGGSCKPGNAAGLFAQPDVDGGLIGGAALHPEDFGAIIQQLP